MRKFLRKFLTVPMTVAILFGFTGIASASPITFSLNDPNAAVSGFPNPFGGVVVNLTSATTATIIFTANESHPNAITFGATNAVDLNVNALGFTSTIPVESGLNPSFTPTFGSFGAPGTVDGLGQFNFQINNFDGFPSSARTFAFILTNTSGTWASSNDVLVNNALGNEVAAHVFVCAVSPALCNSSSGAIATGFVADGPTGKPTQFCTDPAGCDVTPVPEPTTLILMGSGMLLLVRMARHRARPIRVAQIT